MKTHQNEFKNEASIILLGILSEFPGLLDGETEVNGSDLVELLSTACWMMSPDSKKFAATCIDVMGEFSALTMLHNHNNT